MDVIVTENRQTVRKYRVNDASDTASALRRVASVDPTKDELSEGITRINEGESDNATYQTSPAPNRPANPEAVV